MPTALSIILLFFSFLCFFKIYHPKILFANLNVNIEKTIWKFALKCVIIFVIDCTLLKVFGLIPVKGGDYI